MTDLQIETRCIEEAGVIEFQPPLDDEGQEAIHHLGIVGISEFVMLTKHGRDSMEIIFERTNQQDLDKTAQQIAKVFSEQGCIVTFVEELQETPEVIQRMGRFGNLLKRPPKAA